MSDLNRLNNTIHDGDQTLVYKPQGHHLEREEEEKQVKEEEEEEVVVEEEEEEDVTELQQD